MLEAAVNAAPTGLAGPAIFGTLKDAKRCERFGMAGRSNRPYGDVVQAAIIVMRGCGVYAGHSGLAPAAVKGSQVFFFEIRDQRIVLSLAAPERKCEVPIPDPSP